MTAVTTVHTTARDLLRFSNKAIRNLGDKLYSDRGILLDLHDYPASGKTSAALRCAASWARKYKVGFFPIEDDPIMLVDRLMNQFPQEAAATWNNLEVGVDVGVSFMDIERIILDRKYQIVIIDSAHLLGVDQSEFRSMAQALNVVVFVTSCISKE